MASSISSSNSEYTEEMSEATLEDCVRILSMKPTWSNQTLCVHELTDDSAPIIHGLYPFQSHIRTLLANDPCNILVSSPTGSGKTFAIEEASRLSLETGRSLYVAQPLIALAEQVYARLKGETTDKICLRTGPSCSGHDDEALITICTYEVLSRICIKNPQALISSTVLIDEIHYIASDRGPVILEILHSCSDIPIIALSGTLPNKKEFAEFIASINSLPTFITGAVKRPVPVSFHTYDTNTIKCHNLKLARPPPPIDENRLGGLKNKQDLLSCIRCLKSWDSLPLLVVLFSCRKLEKFAEWASCMDHLNANEKSKVTIMFNSMMRTIPEQDHALFASLRAQALRGIGSHHSNLPVPYLELVCRLAEERLVTIVFSSSTLSAGINLPVRTVLLCGARMPQRDSGGKVYFDLLTPLLFNQLAGRAGRPGLESHGYCIIATNGNKGYESAQGLFMRRLPPIRPRDGLTQGDVLRARRCRRKIGLERAIFANPSAKEHITFSNELSGCLQKLQCQHGGWITSQSQKLADAIKAVECYPAIVQYARENYENLLLCIWKDRNQLYHVTKRTETQNDAIEITSVVSKKKQPHTPTTLRRSSRNEM